jgi:two-component system, LytTR family, sensor kinase
MPYAGLAGGSAPQPAAQSPIGSAERAASPAHSATGSAHPASCGGDRRLAAGANPGTHDLSSMSSFRLRSVALKRWAVAFALWTLFGILWSAPNFFGAPPGREGAEFVDSANHVVPFYWAWALLTPGVLWIAGRAARRGMDNWRRWAVVGAASPFVMLIHVIVYLLALRVLHVGAGAISGEEIGRQVLRHGGGDLATYLTLVGVAFLLDANARAREQEIAAAVLESRLARADVELLRWQLHPHFLFNSLNTLSTLVLGDKKEQADRAIQLIARYLRSALAQRGDALVTLDEEVGMASRYAEIEALRFGRGIRLDCHVPDGLGGARVPGSILQPIVENSIQHGGGSITVDVSTAASRLRIAVTDLGAGAHASAPGGTGFGISYVTERLKQFYGTDASFTLSTGAGPSVATIDVPLSLHP